MPGKQYHEVLVFRKTVWLSLSFDDAQGRQTVAHLPGLIPKPGWPYDSQNAGLPIPLLRAYAFTEWSFDTPKRPNGTDLWAQTSVPGQFTIWYSQLNWQDVLSADEPNWRYAGEGRWMATEVVWVVL